MPYEYKKDELIVKDTGKVYHTENPHKLAKEHEYFANKDKGGEKESGKGDFKDNKNDAPPRKITESLDAKDKTVLDKVTKKYSENQGGNPEVDFEKKFNELNKEVKITDFLTKSDFNKDNYNDIKKILISKNDDDFAERLDALSSMIKNNFKSINLPTENDNKIFEHIIKKRESSENWEMSPKDKEKERLFDKARSQNW